MSAEDFQIIDETLYDILILKRDFSEIYHQRGVNLNDSGKKIEFCFRENSNSYQIGILYPKFELKLRKSNSHFDDEITDMIILVNNASAHLFKEATIATTSDSKFEVNKSVSTCSTIMIVLTNKGGDLSSYFDKVTEDEINDSMHSSYEKENNRLTSKKTRFPNLK